MAELKIGPLGPLKGEVELPGDKSVSHRAVMLSAVAKGDTKVSRALFSDDVLATARAFETLGVEIQKDPERKQMLIKGKGPGSLKFPPYALDLGNSGTSMRLLAGLLAGIPGRALLIGDESLMKRPMKRVVEPLRMMGAEIACSAEGTPPVLVKGGKLKGIRYRLPVASAQVKSALLFAGLFAEGETWVGEPGPARDHTERMLPSFGVEVLREKEGEPEPADQDEGEDSSSSVNWVGVRGGAELESPGEIAVPGDFSSAAFFMVAALIVPGSEVVIRNAGINPTRTGLLDLLRRMGASIEVMNQRSLGSEPVADLVVRTSPLRAIEVKGADTVRAIDEIPVLLVAAAKAEGTTVVRDAAELRKKESDRIQSMYDLLRGMGVKVEQFEDGIAVEGPASFKPAAVESRLDHRIAMAAAVAALAAQGEITIKGWETTASSFPGFHTALTALAG